MKKYCAKCGKQINLSKLDEYKINSINPDLLKNDSIVCKVCINNTQNEYLIKARKQLNLDCDK